MLKETLGKLPDCRYIQNVMRDSVGPLLMAALVLTGAMAGCSSKKHASTSTANVVPPALEPAQPWAPDADYKIQVGDELHVRFTYQPEMDEEVPVRSDGRITLAPTGDIEVVGKTPAELEAIIEEMSADSLRSPEVTVVLTKVGEQYVYVTGEVRRPGYVSFRPGITPLQAVAQVGGFLRRAKLDSVLLLTPGADGQYRATRINMEQVVQEGVAERVRLRPNEVVHVPPTWIAEADDVVDQYVRGLIPVLPRVGVGYSLNQQ
jgi:protein involved in polysaccharide export with SLBB domain